MLFYELAFVFRIPGGNQYGLERQLFVRVVQPLDGGNEVNHRAYDFIRRNLLADSDSVDCRMLQSVVQAPFSELPFFRQFDDFLLGISNALGNLLQHNTSS